MLCPEVWDFKAPDSSFSIKKTDSKENDQTVNTINNFYYSHLVSIVVPDTLQLPESVTEALIEDCDYYKVSNLDLKQLISGVFLRNFVNSGCLYALSINTRIDCNNCVAITPKGRLILNLNKETYQSLGLEGVVSQFHHYSKNRYVVSLDLKSNCLKPRTKYYERVRRALSSLESFDLILSWRPVANNDDQNLICPSSIAKYFHDLGFKVNLCKPKHSSATFNNVQVPKCQSIFVDDHYGEVISEEFIEWLGFISIQGNLNYCRPESYLSSFEMPSEESSVLGSVKCLKWFGFFTCDQIENFWKHLRDFQHNGSQWVSMYVQGFSDSPVAWGDQEHHFYTNGDNGYVAVTNGEQLSICTQKCSMKRYNNKY